MPARPTVLFYETSYFRFYGAGMMLLWTMQHLQRIRPLFVTPGQGELTRRVQEAGIETIVLPISERWQRAADSRGARGKLQKLLTAPTLATHVRALARLAREREVMGIHANSTRAALMAGPASRLAHVPMWWHLRRERPLHGAERLAFGMAQQVICVADAVKQTLGNPSKAVVIHDGIPARRMDGNTSGATLRQRLGWAEDALVVGAVGSLTPRKRHDLFIRMAHILAAEFPQARFFIAGHRAQGAPASHEAYLHELAGPLETSGQLVFLGWVEQMSEVFAAMDVFAFPTDNEGIGLVAIEAMQMGVPVVRTNTAGAEDMIEDGRSGFIIPTDDLPALTERVRTLLQDATLRQRMGRAGQEVARARFSARAMTDAIERLMLGES